MNQDCSGERVEASFALWVVCDGLGGHQGGEIAAEVAVDTVLEGIGRIPESDLLEDEPLKELVSDAHRAVLSEQRSRNLPSMRTTLCLVVTDYERARFIHVGDTRGYTFRDGWMDSVTADHSVPQMLHAMGQIEVGDVRGHEDRSRLFQALGQEEPVKPTVGDVFDLATDSALLLCTDGWWELVLETDMEVDLARSTSPGEWLAYMERRVKLRGTGEFDNYSATAILVR